MRTSIRKWGNSLAIRVPKAIAENANLRNGAEVDISVHDGKIIMEPIPDVDIDLASLIAAITEENKHHEVDTGPAVGNEVG